MNKEQAYIKALEWIHSLGRFGSKPGLERMDAMLEALGDPHPGLRYVHVAGTNGKGSTAAMLASIMTKAGYRTGLYTSPYLQSFNNRMTVNGIDVSSGELVDLVDLVRPVVESVSIQRKLGQPTEFEVVTLMAFLFFAQKKVDLVVLEVGLGGRLDATNVIVPLLSVITNVSLDHTQVLGDTVEEVAGEKAGIIKPKVPVITAAEEPAVLEVIGNKAEDVGAPVYRRFLAGQEHFKSAGLFDFSPRSFIPGGQYFSYRGFKTFYDRLFIPLLGQYQLVNASLAVAASELLKDRSFNIPGRAVHEGLAETVWPGRLELIGEKPLLVIDGAHNPGAVKKLSEAVSVYFNYRRLVLIAGIMADKDARSMLAELLPLVDMAIFTRPSLPRAADPGDLASIAVNELHYDKNRVVIVNEVKAALNRALSVAQEEDMILVTGSFYTISDVRAALKQKGFFRPVKAR